jgi:hypothetical protein
MRHVLSSCLWLTTALLVACGEDSSVKIPSSRTLPTITLQVSPAAVPEGDAPRVLALTLRRQGEDLSAASSVRLQALPDTATTQDFEVLDTVVTFAPMQAEATVNLTILGDTTVEPDEALTLRLSEPQQATLPLPNQRLTLTNDDQAHARVSVLGQSVAEGQRGVTQAVATFRLAEALDQPTAIKFTSIDDSAISTDGLADYVGRVSDSVTIPAGQLSVAVPFDVRGDGRFEPDESFTVKILEVVGGVAEAGQDRADITIRNDDPKSPFKVGASRVDSTPTESLCTGGYGIFCGWYATASRPNAIGGQDTLFTRAMVVSRESIATEPEQSVVIITTSAIGVFAAYKDEVTTDGRVLKRSGLYDTRVRLAEALGIPVDRIFIQSDHSHRAPDTIGIWGGVPASFYSRLQQDMLTAAKQAWQQRQPAELYVGAIDGDKIACPAQYFIDANANLGKSKLPRCTVKSLYNFDPNKWVDDEFRVLEARHPDTGARIATFINYSPHATVLDDTGDAVFSGDWTGWAAAMLDKDGAVGLATVGTLGRTDFKSENDEGDGTVRNLAREKSARARLRYFLDSLYHSESAMTVVAGVKPFVRVKGDRIASAEWFIRETVTNPIFFGNYAPFVGIPGRGYPSDTQASIDRAILPPFLSGNLLGTFAGAFRIGDLFFGTAPGEEFPNAQQQLRDAGGVGGAQMHFFLGATNDFLGYMGPASSYDQVVAQGATYFFCPPGEFESNGRDVLSPITSPLGYEAGRLMDEGSCPDHFVLMSSPHIGDHVACSIQKASARIGFTAGELPPQCQLLTATDDVLSPSQSVGAQLPVGADRSAPVSLMGLVQNALVDLLNTIQAAISGQWNGVVSGVQTVLSHAIQAASELLNAGLAVFASEDPATGLSNLLMGVAPGDVARAGVAVVDMTPDVGYCAGQYCDVTDKPDGLSGGDIDPFLTHKSKESSYGVQSRLSARAIVLEGVNKKRVALIKTDNYLAQDALLRRVGQLLQAAGSQVGYEQILHMVTHNHSSSYSATPAWGVWVFQDIFDPRFFERQARAMASAILQAETNLVPARMGATVIRHKIFKGNVVRLAVANDGTPAGYPLEYGDLGLTVMRLDDMSKPQTPKPLAIWMNWGEHPESLDTHKLHSADFLAALERFVDREAGVPLVFSQGDVGSAEASGNSEQLMADDGQVCGRHAPSGARDSQCAPGQGVVRDWNHKGYAQLERAVRFLADDVLKAWHAIGRNEGSVKLSSDFVVDYRNAKVPGPLSHPYPAVSNCSTKTTVEGDVGVPIAGFPDCGRYGFPGDNPLSGQLGLVYATLKAEGIPLPDHYDATAFTAIEENLRIFLQAFRIGEVLLASCACEAQADLILNLESRLNQTADDIYAGFDWYCVAEDKGLIPRDARYAAACDLQRNAYFDVREFPTNIPGVLDNEGGRRDRVRAQIHNDAQGWDRVENVLVANAEAADTRRIWGNFSRTELSPQRGYALPVGIGHAGDYVGYTVSYREFMSRDSYRKALTSYGPHTADYMVTRLVQMAGAMKGGPELLAEPHDALAQVDEVRQKAQSLALGQVTGAAYDAWLAALPADQGPAQVVRQPSTIPLFSAATFRWRGGNTQIDNPFVTVSRCIQENAGSCQSWQPFADMTGEVQTRVHWPQGLPGMVSTYAGQFAWEWTANFEAFKAFPARMGSTPLGLYRFEVTGCIQDVMTAPADHLPGRAATGLRALLPDLLDHQLSKIMPMDCPGGATRYELSSNAFRVTDGPWRRTYTSDFPYISDESGRDTRFCEQCSFRPWMQ